MSFQLQRRNEDGRVFYVLLLEGGKEFIDDFKKLYEGKLEIYPHKLNYGVIESKEKAILELLILNNTSETTKIGEDK